MPTTTLAIAPVTADRWEDLADLLRTSGDSAGCWCAWFRMPNKAYSATTVADKRGALHDFVAAEARPGLLASRDGQAIGWVSIVPRRTLDRIEPPDRPPVEHEPGTIWAVTCFVVRPSERRSGVSVALLDAAVAHARDRGAAAIEGYPVETPRSASSAFPGVRSMFERAGFREVGRFDRWDAVPAASGPEPRRIARAPGRPVMRLDLGA